MAGKRAWQRFRIRSNMFYRGKHLRKGFGQFSRNDLIDIICQMKEHEQSGSQINGTDTIFIQAEMEHRKRSYRKEYYKTMRSTVSVLIVVAALAVLISAYYMPVLRIHGNSMTPTIQEHQIVLAVKKSNYTCGDVAAFYYNNKILIKRIIAKAGDWVDIDESGNVYINHVRLEEPYLAEKYKGDSTIKFPYQVPDGSYFVMGDHRMTSIDSRHSVVGCISKEQFVGKIIFTVWPLSDIGIVK